MYRPTTPQSAYADSSTKARLRMPLPTTPQTAYAASSTKARLRMPQALLRCPYTGEPIRSLYKPYSAALTNASPV